LGRWARAGRPEWVQARVAPPRPYPPARGRAPVVAHRRPLAGPCPTPAWRPRWPLRPVNSGPAPAPRLPGGGDGGAPDARRSRRARPKRPARESAHGAAHDAPARGVPSKRPRARLGGALPGPHPPGRPRRRLRSVRRRRPRPPTAGPTPLRKASHRPRPAVARRCLLPLRPPPARTGPWPPPGPAARLALRRPVSPASAPGRRAAPRPCRCGRPASPPPPPICRSARKRKIDGVDFQLQPRPRRQRLP